MSDMSNSIGDTPIYKPNQAPPTFSSKEGEAVCECPKGECCAANTTDLRNDPLALQGRSQVKSTSFGALDAKTMDTVARTTENMELLHGHEPKMVDGMMNLGNFE